MNRSIIPAPRGFSCGLCSATLDRSWIDLGMSPPANSYVRQEELSEEEAWYPLHPYICGKCFLVQLPTSLPPEKLFSNYPYFSSLSSSWVEHARQYARQMMERLKLNDGSRVIEIGSNDGYLLRHFQAWGVPVLGIESAQNIAAAAEASGVPTRVGFFGLEKARQLVADGIRADLMIANNVLAHVPDLHGFVEGLRVLLKPDGVITAEFPHLQKLVEGCQFDTIYHEHLYYFSLAAVQRLFSDHGLCIFEVEEIPTHGGSLRIFACGAENPIAAVGPSVKTLAEQERAAGMEQLEYYDAFRIRVEKAKKALTRFLTDMKQKGALTAGYGAPAKASTLLNYCGIRQDLLSFTVDRSPWKQGCFLPGSRIPIFHPDRILEVKPDILLILAWNLREEIMEQMSCIRAWGGRFAVPLPEVKLFA